MAICDWHPGQLGVVWAGGLVIQGGCIWLWATNRASHTVVEKPVPYLDFVKSYTVVPSSISHNSSAPNAGSISGCP